MQDFRYKTAVITGAASGIGLATAQALANEGMHVVLTDNREAEVLAAAASIKVSNTRILGMALDVTDADAVTEAAARVAREFGTVHLLMNNAAVFIRGPEIAEVEDAVWDWLLAVNLYGPIHCVRSFLPLLKASGEDAHIVNTGSISGMVVSTRKNGVYATSKFALIAYSEALRIDLALSKVGVSVVLPGAVATEFYEHSAAHRKDLGGPNLYPTTPQDTANGMKPAEVAARIVDGVRHKRFYIATHTSARAALEARHQELMAAYDAAATWKSPL